MTTSSAPGHRVLIVEDEVMIRMMLTDMLQDLGHSVAAEAASLDDALRCANETDFDFAILDVNVNGQQIFPVIDILQKRSRPFVLSTGYAADGLPEPYRNEPTLQKPFELERLRQTIDRLVIRVDPQERSPSS